MDNNKIKKIINAIEKLDPSCYISKKEKNYYYNTLGESVKIGDINALIYELKCMREEFNQCR